MQKAQAACHSSLPLIHSSQSEVVWHVQIFWWEDRRGELTAWILAEASLQIKLTVSLHWVKAASGNKLFSSGWLQSRRNNGNRGITKLWSACHYLDLCSWENSLAISFFFFFSILTAAQVTSPLFPINYPDRGSCVMNGKWIWGFNSARRHCMFMTAPGSCRGGCQFYSFATLSFCSAKDKRRKTLRDEIQRAEIR